VLIVLESTRGDSLGRRVGGREVTPALNALAREGSVARGAYSHVGFTTESLKSLFSGTLSPEPGGPSLFQDLKANGYHLGVLSSQAESWGEIDQVVGSRRHADRFIDAEVLKDERVFSFAAKASLKVDGRSLLREFGKAYGQREAWSRPNFLYFNFQEAHFPYYHRGMPQILPGRPIPRGDIEPDNRDWVANTYWNAVAFDDWLVGQVVSRLKALGIWEETLLVVTADHGESLFDDDFLGHGHVLNRAQTHVPLIFSDPNVPHDGPVGLADYRGLILRSLTAAPAPPPNAAVFQYIGTLERPAVVGMVEPGGVWTTLNLETEEVEFSDLGLKARYRELAPGTKLRARADRLANEWARQRWAAARR
jgi:glucan phosphoethanolaminetransferase (alkaline phosphatase superfamily)